MPICAAFNYAKQAVSFKIRYKEADLFLLLTEEDLDEDSDDESKQKDEGRHDDCFLEECPHGEWQCKSEHNLVKHIPAKLDKLKFREKEIS